MREFLKAIHDYPDEATGILMVIIIIAWLVFMYKVSKK